MLTLKNTIKDLLTASLFLAGLSRCASSGLPLRTRAKTLPDASSKTAARKPADSVAITVFYEPAPVCKTTTKRIFVHLLPWFESKASNPYPGKWGQHWTMLHENPDSIGADDRCQIASWYYPLTGPYASGDSTIIDYQLLLMKFSGIDGVLIDWPGTLSLSDFTRNRLNTEKIIDRLDRVGLKFAIVYEDGNIGIAFRKKIIADQIAAAKRDLSYLQDHYFSRSDYELLDGKPILLDFGPRTFTKENDWRAIFAMLRRPVAFFTLWGQSPKLGKTTAGEFAWISPDNLPSLIGFYNNGHPGIKIGSAYPGFDPYYAQGGWDGPTFIIPGRSTNNFRSTIDLALRSNAPFIQLATWNDYGEGTMIEPTLEYQYSLLTTLQQKLGVRLRQPDLELVYQFYRDRLLYTGNAAVEKNLDQVFYFLASLRLPEAAALLNQIEKINQSTNESCRIFTFRRNTQRLPAK
jgi:hypothetical protein